MAMKVLVVDDSITMVMSLKTTLTMNGFEVETARQRPDSAGQIEFRVSSPISSSPTSICR